MEDKQLDAIKFAVNEKADGALKLMQYYAGTDREKTEFFRGQYLAFNEVYSLLTNVQ